MGKEKVLEFLKKLGLNKDEANIYIALWEEGTSSVLQLSRYTGIGRSKIYRMIDLLKKKGVVIESNEGGKIRFKAGGIELIRKLREEKSNNLKEIDNKLEEVVSFFNGFVGINDDKTQILTYKGRDGIKQLLWNILRAKDEILGYSYSPMDEFVTGAYKRKWISEFNKRQLKIRDIYSDRYRLIQKTKGYNSWVDVEKASSRYISDEILKLNHQMDIYNDVVSIYYWGEEDMFGVELLNPDIAMTQRQLFELAWDRSEVG